MGPSSSSSKGSVVGDNLRPYSVRSMTPSSARFRKNLGSVGLYSGRQNHDYDDRGYSPAVR